MSHDDFEREPIAGLPAVPPPDETILWQGSPSWRTVARRVLHVDLVAAYFALMLAWRIATGLGTGQTASELVSTLLPFVALSLAAIGVLTLIAWRIERTTIYTITSRRVAMRFGVALPITFNIPFRFIQSAGVRRHGQGHGDLALELAPGERLAYLVLWPHARPWRLRSPQPMFRALADIDATARILSEALVMDGARSTVVRLPVGAADEANDVRPVLVAAE